MNESKASQRTYPEPAAVNPKTGKAERVFVNLEAVYPDGGHEFSFEELRARRRGWSTQDWRSKPASPLKVTSENIQRSPSGQQKGEPDNCDLVQELSEDLQRKAVLEEVSIQSSPTVSMEIQTQSQSQEARLPKPKRTKIREIKQEAQTSRTTKLILTHDIKLTSDSQNQPLFSNWPKAETEDECGTNHDVSQQGSHG